MLAPGLPDNGIADRNQIVRRDQNLDTPETAADTDGILQFEEIVSELAIRLLRTQGLAGPLNLPDQPLQVGPIAARVSG